MTNSFSTSAFAIFRRKGADKTLTPLWCFSLVPCPEIMSLLGVKLPVGICSVRNIAVLI